MPTSPPSLRAPSTTRPAPASEAAHRKTLAVLLSAFGVMPLAMAESEDARPGAGARPSQVQQSPAVQQQETLPTVHVRSERIDARTYDRDDIDATPTGNRDLSSLIADTPSVRLNPTMENSANRGSLAPESFSIHGESPYQNQFLIDGISGTNVIRPQETELTAQVGRVPGFSQAYNLDTDLLEQVRVYDSNVPVEFGHFQGGVVDARIRTPQGSNSVVLKRSFNSSGLTQQRVPDAAVPDWVNGEPGYAAQWKKHFTSIHGDFKLGEDTNALLGLSRRESRIQRQSLVLDRSVAVPNGRATRLETHGEGDVVDNFIGKLHRRWGGGTETSLVLKASDRQEDLVSNTFADSAWTNRQLAYGLGFDLVQPLDSGVLTTKLGFDQLDARRDSSSNEFTTQRFEDSSLSQYIHGGYGRESLDQRQYAAKLRMDWNAFSTASVQHQVYAGADWQRTEASFVRHEEVFSNLQTLLRNGTQRITTRNQYLAGTVDAGYSALGLYVSDAMRWGNWGLVAGARVDRDNFLGNTNLAPRMRLDWDALGNGNTRLRLGWSRYYGLDTLGYALEQGRSQLERRVVRGGVVVNESVAGTGHEFEGLKTPHSNEWAFDVAHRLNPHLEAGFAYVNRLSRDGLTRDGSATAGYHYTNAGRGKTDSVTLSLRGLKPVRALAADWKARLDFNWQRSRRNHDSTRAWEAEGLEPDDIVSVNGTLMPRRDKPPSEFHQPRRASLGFTGEWKQTGVTWGNRLNWNSARTGIGWVGRIGGVERYVSQRLPSYWTWDLNLAYQPVQLRGLKLSVDVLNVLNRIEPIAIGSSLMADNVRYKTGREIWFNVAYQF